MSDATELTPALKRNRITISEPTTVSLASPLTVARAQLRSGLPSLAQSTHTVVQHFFNSLIALWITFSQKKKALQLFENDSFIPTSARLSVELTGSAAIRDTPEFQALSLKTKESVSFFQQSAKQHMKDTLGLELKQLTTLGTTLLVEGVVKLIRLSRFAASGAFPNPEELLGQAFRTLRHPSCTHPLTQSIDLVNSELEKQTGAELTDHLVDGATINNDLFMAIHSVLLKPLIKFTEAEKHNLLQAKIKKESELILKETITAATAMELEKEPSIDPVMLNELVSTMVARALASKQKQKPPAKNTPRGAAQETSSAPSSKKTKQNAKKTTAAARNNSRRSKSPAPASTKGRANQAPPTAACAAAGFNNGQRAGASGNRKRNGSAKSKQTNNTGNGRSTGRQS